MKAKRLHVYRDNVVDKNGTSDDGSNMFEEYNAKNKTFSSILNKILTFRHQEAYEIAVPILGKKSQSLISPQKIYVF